MRRLRHGIKAELVRQSHKGEGFLKATGNILTVLRLAAHHQPELEFFYHHAFPCSISRMPTRQLSRRRPVSHMDARFVRHCAC